LIKAFAEGLGGLIVSLLFSLKNASFSGED